MDAEWDVFLPPRSLLYNDLGLNLNVIISNFPKSSLNAPATPLKIVREMHCSGELTSSARGSDAQWLHGLMAGMRTETRVAGGVRDSSELHLLALVEGLILNYKKTNSPDKIVLTQWHRTNKWQISGLELECTHSESLSPHLLILQQFKLLCNSTVRPLPQCDPSNLKCFY